MQREKKTEIITLRVTPQVKERIRAKAQELSLSVTDYLCCLLYTSPSPRD